jgi:carbon monoxide dehydrogenase subunit G
MQLENRFDVPASADVAWALLNDVPAVVPCMPGAELVDVVDGDTWKVRLRVRLGPISLQFLADLSRERTEPEERRAVISIDAREAKGRGTASATITSTVEDAAVGARVSIVTELALKGPLAQYGRPIVAPVAERLTQQFAAWISQRLAATPSGHTQDAEPQEAATPSETSKPIGLRTVLGAVWQSLTRKESR